MPARRLGPFDLRARSTQHLQDLRRYWVERVRDLPGMQILTPEEPARYGAVTSFRLPAVRDYARAQALSRRAPRSA